MEQDIQLFVEYLTVELGLAANTREAYARDLRLFAQWNQKATKAVKRQDIIAYITSLKKERYAPTSIARKLAALKAFFRFMTVEGYLELDPAEVVEAGNKGTILPKVLSHAEVDKLLAAPDVATKEGYRDRTMGSESATEIMREGIALGANDGILVNDPAVKGSDTLATGRVLAKAIEKIGGVEIVVTGKKSSDGDTGQIPPAVAQRLGMP